MLAIVKNDEHPARTQIVEYGGEIVVGITPNTERGHERDWKKSLNRLL